MRPLLALGLIALASCGSEPVAPPTDFGPVIGLWSGTASIGTIVEVSIRAPGTDALRGCVAFGFDPESRPNDRVIVAASGVLDGGSVTLATDTDQAITWSFAGTRTEADVLSGTAAGSALRLQRTSPTPAC